MSDAEFRSAVREHIEAIERTAAKLGVPNDVAGRTVLQELTELWLRDRAPEDVASELRFVADNLGETDFEFMRP